MLLFQENINHKQSFTIEVSQETFDRAPMNQKFTCELYSCYDDNLPIDMTKEDILNQAALIGVYSGAGSKNQI
jgi:hypothetical protein